MAALPVFLDIHSCPLHEMLRQLDPLRFPQGSDFPVLEVLAQKTEKRPESRLDPAVRSRGQQHQVSVAFRGEFLNKAMPLMLILVPRIRRSRPVRLIHDHQVWTVHQEQMAVPFALHKVDARHLDRVVPVNALGRCLPAFQLSDRARADDHGIQVKLLTQLLVPLFAQVWGAEDAQPTGVAAVQHFTRHQKGLDGLAHTHVIRYQQPHRVEAQAHKQGHELVSPGPDRHPSQRPQGRRAFPQGQPRRLPKQVRANRVRKIIGSRGRELGRPHPFLGA